MLAIRVPIGARSTKTRSTKARSTKARFTEAGRGLSHVCVNRDFDSITSRQPLSTTTHKTTTITTTLQAALALPFCPAKMLRPTDLLDITSNKLG
jgi:hypothetical protein